MEHEELVLGLGKLAVRFSEGWHEGIKIDALDIVLLNEAAEALAQPAQEPSYWLGYGLQAHTEKPFNDATPLYTAPPQRPWVGLTAKEAAECWTTSATQTWKNIEAKLKEKNT